MHDICIQLGNLPIELCSEVSAGKLATKDNHYSSTFIAHLNLVFIVSLVSISLTYKTSGEANVDPGSMLPS